MHNGGAHVNMQKVRIILILVSVLTLLTPFVVVGITYRNNPVQLVVPSQIKQIIGSSVQAIAVQETATSSQAT